MSTFRKRPLFPRQNTKYLRYKIFLSVLFFVIFIQIFYHFSIRLASNILYLKGKNAIRNENYKEAISCLQNAVHYLPGDNEAWKELGTAHSAQANRVSFIESYNLLHTAKSAYSEAVRINPLDSDGYFALAITEARIEKLYSFIHQGQNPFNAIPYFEQAIKFGPSFHRYYFAFAKYLYGKNQIEPFLNAVSNFVRVYPSEWGRFKEKPFWSPDVKTAIRSGLDQAMEFDFTSQNARIALTALLADDNN